MPNPGKLYRPNYNFSDATVGSLFLENCAILYPNPATFAFFIILVYRANKLSTEMIPEPALKIH